MRYWYDNACTLAWIRDKPERWKSFVEIRIKEIQRYSKPQQWAYVRTEEKVADVLSRPSALDSEDLRRFWLSGPDWLLAGGWPERHILNEQVDGREIVNEKRSQYLVNLIACEV